MGKSIRRCVIAFAASLLTGAAARAVDVQIKDPNGGHPDKINFGVLISSVPYHTAPQYLEITHSGLSFRRLYFYTDNIAGSGLAQEGLVSTSSGVSFPLYFQNVTSTPSAVQFTASTASDWGVLVDSSSLGFGQPMKAVLLPGPNNLSWVYLGTEIHPTVLDRGTFASQLVFEDWSEYGDLVGPTFALSMVSNLILLRDVPVGISAVLRDDSPIVDYTLHYRLEDSPLGFQSADGGAPSVISAEAGGDGFSWMADVVLDPNYTLRAPDSLEYYFTAVDTYTNTSTSVHYRMNLFPENGLVPLDYSAGAGSVGVAIGDPRWLGLEVQFPVGSLRSGGTLTVGLKDPAAFPSNDGTRAARVFQFGPNDLSFLRPVTLLLPYMDRDNNGKEDGTGANETDLRLFWYDGFSWRYVGGTVDPVGNRVRVNVTHLGEYGLFPFAGSLTADLIRPKEHILTFNYPNDLLRFSGVDATAGSFDIEIFDVRGMSVRKIHNSAEWDGRDENGSRVESGTYVYRFEGQGITLSGMIAVAR